MDPHLRTFAVGHARVTVVNIGDIHLPLASYMNVPADALRTRDDLRGLAAQTVVPIHAVHVQLPHASVLVDAGAYDVVSEPEYAIPGYEPPAGLVPRLIASGIRPESVDHVVFTHRHWDHFNGATRSEEGEHRPEFPRARHYLGRADWEALDAKLADAASVEARSLGELHRRGILEFVDGDRDLAEGVRIVAAPGETAGHQIVRIESGGEVLYCLGDLYHHPIELAHPEWMVRWADPATIAGSRRDLTRRALAERALLVATHIPPLGRLRAIGDGVAWVSEAAAAAAAR